MAHAHGPSPLQTRVDGAGHHCPSGVVSCKHLCSAIFLPDKWNAPLRQAKEFFSREPEYQLGDGSQTLQLLDKTQRDKEPQQFTFGGRAHVRGT